MKRKHETQITSHESRMNAGSALILTVVLTSLLAVVGIMFVMVARVNKISTSAISENKELNLAVETVIAKISQELVLDSPNDVPGVPGLPGQEYYDYPGPNDTWLASLEPYYEDASGDYRWRQVSDIYNRLGAQELWDPNGYFPAEIIPDYQDPTKVNESNSLTPEFYPADADGDGVSDSVWIKLDGITSSKGKPIYAAVRVVDNSGMLNVNTGYKFDPCEVPLVRERIDGSSQTQINLAALSLRGANGTLAEAADRLQAERCGTEPNNLLQYENKVVWLYNTPEPNYTPFDISDELKLRNRYILNYNLMTSRIEKLWTRAYEAGPRVPLPTTNYPFSRWPNCTIADIDPDDYEYRHISTAYNMDRIIDIHGDKMININEVNSLDVDDLYNRLTSSIDPNMDWTVRRPIERRFAQLAVNIIDFADRDDYNGDGILDDDSVTTFVTTFIDPCEIAYYYGFEAQPFISEIAFKIGRFPEVETSNFYAVELYNPFNVEIDINDFQLEIAEVNAVGGVIIDFNGVSGKTIDPNGHFIIADNLNAFYFWNMPEDRIEAPLRFFGYWKVADKSKPPIDRRERPDKSKPPIYIGFEKPYNLFLRRRVIVDVDGSKEIKWIYVDKQLLDPYALKASAGREAYFARDDYGWHIVYQTLVERGNSLGTRNYFHLSHDALRQRGYNFSFFLPNPLAADPNHKFITVGDIPRILTIGNGVEPNSTIGQRLQQTGIGLEGLVRLDLQNPFHRNVFQYLTVFDPTTDGINNDGDWNLLDGTEMIDEVDLNRTPELKIPGRININTAPWYVIAQLPWMTREIAQAIVAYRDKLEWPVNYYQGDPNNGRELATGIPGVREDFGFESIGELTTVINNDPLKNNYDMRYYALDGTDQLGFPDLTTDVNELGDSIVNDFEERDVIFSRISNLVTVRSDVFTAYILVRIGADGPQKRVIAILDRSDIYSGRGRVKVVAMHYVPDPR